MNYSNLTYSEREDIEFYLNNGFNYTEIAKMLKRDLSTISREISRNKHSWYGYQAAYAQVQTEKRIYGKRAKPVLEDFETLRMVAKNLELGWSPHVISGRAKMEKSKIQISTESIYRLIYHDYKKGGSLWELLLSKKKRRKNHLGRPDQRGKISGGTSIDERPDAIDNRSRYGHWEGDTVIGRAHKGAIFTAVERKSRYMLGWNAGGKDANWMAHCIHQAFKEIPSKLRKTLTVDNGLEFSSHSTISDQNGVDVYFSHPGRPYEKGAVENANKFLRKYFPTGTSFKNLTYWKVKKVIDKINNTPRKILNYLTAKEVLFNNGKIALQI